VEIGRYLTENARFAFVPALAGTMEYTRNQGEPAALALLQAFVPNQGDGWTWTLEELERYYQECSLLQPPVRQAELEPADLVRLSDAPLEQIALERMGLYIEAAATLGRRTAELHLALSAPTDDPAFAPEPFTAGDLERLIQGLNTQAARAFDVLKDALSGLPDAVVEPAGLVLSRRRRILESLREITPQPTQGLRTRVHGDYHLGQVVRVKNDYVILDFEGEPSRTVEERRAKQSPLKDVAGMLRSFSYAAWQSLAQFTHRGPDAFERLVPWARVWERNASAAFLRAYRETAAAGAFLPADSVLLGRLLDIYVLEKALYEVLYELNNRPAWVWIPLRRILAHPL
jgi:maltose alpha-D-glucosyltransferase/alpha-amylase